MAFCKDFGIFPDIIPRAKLTQIFSDLATLHPMLSQKNQEKSDTLIDQLRNQDSFKVHRFVDENLFTEIFALVATEIEDNVSAHPIEKVNQLIYPSFNQMPYRSCFCWKECIRKSAQRP